MSKAFDFNTQFLDILELRVQYKNPAYGRHRLSRHVRIVAPILLHFFALLGTFCDLELDFSEPYLPSLFYEERQKT